MGFDDSSPSITGVDTYGRNQYATFVLYSSEALGEKRVDVVSSRVKGVV